MYWSRRWESNPQPSVYDTLALPLSHFGKKILALASDALALPLSHFGVNLFETGFFSTPFRNYYVFYYIRKTYTKGSFPEQALPVNYQLL